MAARVGVFVSVPRNPSNDGRSLCSSQVSNALVDQFSLVSSSLQSVGMVHVAGYSSSVLANARSPLDCDCLSRLRTRLVALRSGKSRQEMIERALSFRWKTDPWTATK